MFKKTVFTASIAALAFAAAASAQPPAPKPGNEQSNLAHFLGTWKMEGSMQPSPFGPGGAFNGSETCRMFEGGWHVVCDSTGSGAMGDMKGHAILTYDRTTKQYRYIGINNMPDAELATGGLSGKTWTFTNKVDAGGKTFHSRFVIVETSPSVHTMKWEMSEDGKTWKTIMDGTATKVGT
jgi:hypothetical protein